MNTSDAIKVLFYSADQKLNSEHKEKYEFQKLIDHLKELNFSIEFDNDFQSDFLNYYDIFVLSFIEKDLSQKQYDNILKFSKQGKGLLVLSNPEDLPEYMPNLDKFLEKSGFVNHEYFNYKIKTVQDFLPHYITTNIKQIYMDNLSVVKPINDASALAYTNWTKSPVIACRESGVGRVVAIGDVSLFCDRFIDNSKDNKKLAGNIFKWLAFVNPVDITELEISPEVIYGEKGLVLIRFKNVHDDDRVEMDCLLESDADAVIDEPVLKKRSIPPKGETLMQWNVRPQRFGAQSLRFSISTQDESLHYDKLPEMQCLAPGHLTMEIKDCCGELCNHFKTGVYFNVAGKFHWNSTKKSTPFIMVLRVGEGLAICDHEPEKSVWQIKAINPGVYDLLMTLPETGQEVSSKVSVERSVADQIEELYIRYVYPLDVIIAGRLKQVDERLVDDAIRNIPFKIIPPKEYVREVYEGETWREEVLDAANQEIWYNPELLDSVLIDICPAYKPNKGAFIPYDPSLATHLATLFSSEKKRLEFNLISLKDSDEANIKQNIAAYLLHEKYGHGSFYAKTLIGKQLALLDEYGVFNENGPYNAEHIEAANLINDSSILVSEGFGAWLEISFLNELDPDIRQAAHQRYLYLIREAQGQYRSGSDFFKSFQPRYQSRYREGFEHFDMVERKYNKRCAVRAFFLANQINFGIIKSVEGGDSFQLPPSEIIEGLLGKEDPRWHSHVRLEKIADLLYDYSEETPPNVCRQFGYLDEHQVSCPIEKLIKERLKWRL